MPSLRSSTVLSPLSPVMAMPAGRLRFSPRERRYQPLGTKTLRCSRRARSSTACRAASSQWRTTAAAAAAGVASRRVRVLPSIFSIALTSWSRAEKEAVQPPVQSKPLWNRICSPPRRVCQSYVIGGRGLPGARDVVAEAEGGGLGLEHVDDVDLPASRGLVVAAQIDAVLEWTTGAGDVLDLGPPEMVVEQARVAAGDHHALADAEVAGVGDGHLLGAGDGDGGGLELGSRGPVLTSVERAALGGEGGGTE